MNRSSHVDNRDDENQVLHNQKDVRAETRDSRILLLH